jgi:hypothetical protein
VQSRLEHKLDSKLFDVADKMEMKVDDLKASAKLGAGEVKQAAARLTRWPLDRSSCTRSLTTGAGGDGGIDHHQELTEISLRFYSFAIPFLLAASPRRPPAGRPAGCTPRSSLSTGAMGVLRRVREGGVKVGDVYLLCLVLGARPPRLSRTRSSNSCCVTTRRQMRDEMEAAHAEQAKQVAPPSAGGLGDVNRPGDPWS